MRNVSTLSIPRQSHNIFLSILTKTEKRLAYHTGKVIVTQTLVSSSFAFIKKAKQTQLGAFLAVLLYHF